MGGNANKYIDIESEDQLKFNHPFTAIVASPTGGGKTTLCFKLIDNLMNITTPKINKVIYLYSSYQKIFEKYEKRVFFTKDQRYLNPFTPPEGCNVIIFVDDLMNELSESDALLNFYTKHSHHTGVSIVLLMQNYFFPSKKLKSVRDNTQYVIIGKHRTDVSKIDILARQIEGVRNWRYFVDVYNDVTTNEDGKKELIEMFLLIDLSPRSKISHITKYRTHFWNLFNQVLYLKHPDLKK